VNLHFAASLTRFDSQLHHSLETLFYRVMLDFIR
jgi:hypothetical protein